jgi:DNA-binding NtrC family response regulator
METLAREQARADGPAVLVVVDHEAVLRLIEHRLGRSCRCAVAASAETALRLLVRERFDVVLVDIGLPGDSCFDVHDFVRTCCPQTEVVTLIGVEVPAAARRAVEAAGFGLATWPADVDGLMDLVEGALGRLAARRPAERVEEWRLGEIGP